MKKLFFVLLCAASVAAVSAAEYSYVWGEVYPNYKSQIPSSDFVTPDGVFRFTSDKASGTSGPQFNADNKAGLLLRLYADNTLRIESLNGFKITDITFVIGGNGHAKLAQLTPSSGTMQDVYTGNDESDSFREYRLFWKGETTDITFTVGHECFYGYECAEQGKEGEPGTCMTKQMILTTTAPEGIEYIDSQESRGAYEHSGKCQKLLRNGQLFILRGNQSYTVLGQQLK